MFQLTITPSGRVERDSVLVALFSGGIDSVEEAGQRLITFVADAAAAKALGSRVREADPGATVVAADVPSVDWSTAWRDRLTAHRVGAITITPPWLAEGLDPAHTIVIEPAMAFGTGDHATTRGVLALMQGEVRAGDFVTDLGAGSAVLAIAAAKLGAARAVAIELDAEAIANAELNVERNGVASQVRVIEGDALLLLPLLAPVRLIVANIVSSVILSLVPAAGSSLVPGGVAIFSGMLTDERDRMLDEFTAGGFTLAGEVTEEEWWSVRLRR